jgi:hypothetical protein
MRLGKRSFQLIVLAMMANLLFIADADPAVHMTAFDCTGGGICCVCATPPLYCSDINEMARACVEGCGSNYTPENCFEPGEHEECLDGDAIICGIE